MGRRDRAVYFVSLWSLVMVFAAGCSTVNRTAEAPVAVAPAYARAVRSEDPTPQVNQRRTCLQALHDVFTKPWYGNYLGPDNFGFDKKPIDALDAAARDHDWAYGQYHVAGFGGAFVCPDAGWADLQLAKRAFEAIPSLDFGGKLMGVATGITMGCLGVIKIPIVEIRDAIHLKSQPPITSQTS